MASHLSARLPQWTFCLTRVFQSELPIRFETESWCITTANALMSDIRPQGRILVVAQCQTRLARGQSDAEIGCYLTPKPEENHD